MQFAERLPRALAAATLCITASGCASVLSPQTTDSASSAAPVTTAGAGKAATSKAAPTPAATATPVVAAAPAVAPAVQRTFDSASRALDLGQVVEAERGFLTLTKSNPDLAGPHANLALIYRQAGKLDQAVAELEQAAQTNPQQPAFHNELGITYRQLGQFGKAREAYERAIALDPNYAAAQLNLGILLDLYLWDSRAALQAYERYMALLPSGDDTVRKWIADIRNRQPQQSLLSRKEN